MEFESEDTLFFTMDWTDRRGQREEGSAGKLDFRVSIPLWSEMARVWIVFLQMVKFPRIFFPLNSCVREGEKVFYDTAYKNSLYFGK